MSKTSKKTAKRPLTRRQAEIKAAKILRGMDNSVARIRKETASMAEGAEELKAEVLPALSRAPEETAKPKAAKKPAKAKPKAPSKKAKKPAKAKPKAAKKPAKAKFNGKSSAEAKSRSVPNPKDNPPVEGRPTIKEACVEIIGAKGGKCSAAELYRTAWSKWGYWSRQSLYNALKDKKLFRKVGDLYEVVAKPKKKASGTQDAEADAFVKTVTKDDSVSQAI